MNQKYKPVDEQELESSTDDADEGASLEMPRLNIYPVFEKSEIAGIGFNYSVLRF
jgi:hypothetical protein